jgi:hypothetical protein
MMERLHVRDSPTEELIAHIDSLIRDVSFSVSLALTDSRSDIPNYTHAANLKTPRQDEY